MRGSRDALPVPRGVLRGCRRGKTNELGRADERWPDLVILDLMLPGIDGLEVCRHLRATRRCPSSCSPHTATKTVRVVGLELGADDYVSKPFSPRELTAHPYVPSCATPAPTQTRRTNPWCSTPADCGRTRLPRAHESR